jgi:hypothetical protein
MRHDYADVIQRLRAAFPNAHGLAPDARFTSMAWFVPLTGDAERDIRLQSRVIEVVRGDPAVVQGAYKVVEVRRAGPTNAPVSAPSIMVVWARVAAPPSWGGRAFASLDEIFGGGTGTTLALLAVAVVGAIGSRKGR